MSSNQWGKPTRPFRPPIFTPSSVTPFVADGTRKPLDSNTSTSGTRSFSESATLVGHPCYRYVQLRRTQSMPPPPLLSAPSTAPTMQPQPPSMVKVPPPWSLYQEQTVLHPPVKPPTTLFTTSMFPQELPGTSR